MPSAPYKHYDIKPEPKPDVVVMANLRCLLDGSCKSLINDIYIGHPKNIKLTFDGDTGNLKAAEVIK